MKFYGDGIPGVHAEDLVGKLVVIEGADGSGRSTQIDLLRDYLEGKGHATVNMGLRRSTLVSEELQEAKQGNVLSEITRSLFYATDFADQLENRIMPALRAGFIVLADRYIYTLMARDIVRGADRGWVQSLYGIALIPDLVIYLRVSPAQLVERNFRKNPTLDYWEAGMDLGLSRDIFDSFIRYQRLIQKEFALMQEEYSFHVVSGNLSIRSVGREIVSLVEQKLEV
ncbi:thymidylate kinase [Geobacter sp. AOG1]|uniref:dTMP kinase n=1 Tax=Geobacter sp. AOG1 TaxID=1566346 RepID=UPI001CC692EC|nr:thymidylate kinase [Geobacter sp. AOG1]GFE57918.1 thymidylate kinase [Geobacter sp. AOG1]